jgi:hypothetical protein
MISNQETLNLSPFMAIYDMGVPSDNQLRPISQVASRPVLWLRLPL